MFEQTGSSPALEEGQHEELRGAVQLPSSKSGMELEGGAAVRLGTVRRQPQPVQLPELPAQAGACLQVAEE